jgi:cation/acetate symporter
MVTGALACGTALLSAAAFPGLTPLAEDLFSQPAAWTVPLAFAVMVGVSRATRARGEDAIDRVMARLHTPER